MKSSKRLAVAVGVGIAPFLALSLPANTASAHGYVSSPPSRQAQCAAGAVECGAVAREPQSVQGPLGLTSCSGGNADFAELDDDAKGWTVTPVDRTAAFTWRLTARHATSTWQYFVDGTRVAEFDSAGGWPEMTVTHQVDFGELTGRQKVLAVWNTSENGDAYYACVDVNVR